MVASHMLSLCQRTRTSAELLYFDLDGFKAINDSEGHAAGDRLLKRFSKLLVKSFRNADVIARLGGDEFVVLMTASQDACATALARLEKMAREDADPEVRQLLWSVGKVAYDPARHDCVDSLLADGDRRMYQNKQEKRAASSSRNPGRH
jgi:diguanylate cyclase (GGDEF)-like protein